ncbi:hypothetical protein GCM10025868_11790 [Angustibacter aerolatus]|uniref:Uncharacterized protein n=1 Tax=Angustibacter aerolatus TaxID=1162965 RepID=A0ABQ6JET1_9ACTN|nr:hypothetical protein GCM10025868_11790 [Angustibacter aerolatus]
MITGGDSGIGRAVALAFAREGADVLIAYLEDEEEDAQETVRLVEDAGRKAVTCPGDLRDESHCQQVIDTAVQEPGWRRRAGEQRGVPDGAARWHRRHHDRAVRPRHEDEPVRDVLVVEDGAAAHAARLDDHQHRVDPGHHALARACSTTPPPRVRSSTSPRAWPRASPSRASA